MKDFTIYLLIRLITLPFRFMSYRWIRICGKILGWVGFYTLHSYRKRTLSNLALASKLALTHQQIRQTAIASFQNLAINCLEYPKLEKESYPSAYIDSENLEMALDLYSQNKGVIFFCAHQANWEVLFLEGTAWMRGVAIGKSIKNSRLYRWIVSIREKNGGTIISQREALREGLRALKQGKFLGIVGDQGMPNSDYEFPFLGRRARTSTAPALLAYKAKCPIVFTSTKRTKTGYRICFHPPIWPNCQEPKETEMIRIMDLLLTQLEQSLCECPEEWLWQHNRWKQQTPLLVYKAFRYDTLLVILPPQKKDFEKMLPALHMLRSIYPRNFLSLLTVHPFSDFPVDELLFYSDPQEVLLKDYRFKLVFNWADFPHVKQHYQRQSAFAVLSWEELARKAGLPLPSTPLPQILQKALCRTHPETPHAC